MISRVFANAFQMLSITPRTWSTGFCLVWPLLLLQPHCGPAPRSSHQLRHPDRPGDFLHVHSHSFAQLSPFAWNPYTSHSFCSEFFPPVPSCLILISYFLICIILNMFYISTSLQLFPILPDTCPLHFPSQAWFLPPSISCTTVSYMSPSKHLMQL